MHNKWNAINPENMNAKNVKSGQKILNIGSGTFFSYTNHNVIIILFCLKFVNSNS